MRLEGFGSVTSKELAIRTLSTFAHGNLLFVQLGSKTRIDEWRDLQLAVRSIVPLLKKLVAPEELTVPLTENDKSILQAMYELGASIDNLVPAATILQAALGDRDPSGAFSRLKANELVDNKTGRNGGYWLTEKGQKYAKSLE